MRERERELPKKGEAYDCVKVGGTHRKGWEGGGAVTR